MRIDIRMAAVLAAGLAACTATPREAASPTPAATTPPVFEQAPATASPGAPGSAASPAAGMVTAQLAPTRGNKARGTVTFEPSGSGVRVTAHLEGLPPGEHGFHLHQNGDCSAPDASSAGDHWNPTSQPHGGPDSPQHHAGDLGNVTADASGTAHMETVAQGLSLQGAQSAVGRAVIVHGQPDDFKTQPTGNAGPRLACGVVGGDKSPSP